MISSADPRQLSNQYGAIFRWFNYYLAGNGSLTDELVTFAYSHLPVDSTGRFTWSDSTMLGTLPGTFPLRFYLGADSTLSTRIVGPDTVTLHNRWNSQYSFDMGYIEGFQGTWFYQNLPKEQLVFESQPFATDLLWLGSPRMQLKVSSPYEKFPMHAQIFEVDTAGSRAASSTGSTSWSAVGPPAIRGRSRLRGHSMHTASRKTVGCGPVLPPDGRLHHQRCNSERGRGGFVREHRDQRPLAGCGLHAGERAGRSAGQDPHDGLDVRHVTVVRTRSPASRAAASRSLVAACTCCG